MRSHIKFRPRSFTWEQIKKPTKNQVFFKKFVYEKKYGLQHK